jgi:23S rRNA (guanosine2251-2'-O)-methyltransferase
MKSVKGKNLPLSYQFKGETLYGVHACFAALDNPNRQIISILTTQKYHDAVMKKGIGCVVKVVSAEQLSKLVGDDSVHQGIVIDVKPLPEVLLDDVLQGGEEASSLLILDQVTDPHNIGAILRSAAVFGASALILTERHSPKVTGVLAKIASGALEQVPLVYVGNLVQALNQMKKAGSWISGLAEEGKQFAHTVKFDQKTALVMGAEGTGLRRMTRETCDILVKLPTSATFSTLNVSNAAAIILYEVHRQKLKE